MAKVLTIFRTETITEDNIKAENLKDLVFIHGLTVARTKAISKTG